MTLNFNQVSLIGNLGQDPELLKETDKGAFVRLKLATNRAVTTLEGEKIQTTQWHTVYLNNGTGRYMATHAKKGALVFIQGELRNRSWKNAEGREFYETAVYAQRAALLLRENASASITVEDHEVETESEEIPF